jgi:hypothetical protein
MASADLTAPTPYRPKFRPNEWAGISDRGAARWQAKNYFNSSMESM